MGYIMYSIEWETLEGSIGDLVEQTKYMGISILHIVISWLCGFCSVWLKIGDRQWFIIMFTIISFVFWKHCHNRGYTPFSNTHTHTSICTTLKRHVSVLEVMFNESTMTNNHGWIVWMMFTIARTQSTASHVSHHCLGLGFLTGSCGLICRHCRQANLLGYGDREPTNIYSEMGEF